MLSDVYNENLSLKSQEIDQSQSIILFIFDCDWSISYGLTLKISLQISFYNLIKSAKSVKRKLLIMYI